MLQLLDFSGVRKVVFVHVVYAMMHAVYALCCSMWQCVAVLQCVLQLCCFWGCLWGGVCAYCVCNDTCSVLQCVAPYCSALQCVAV